MKAVHIPLNNVVYRGQMRAQQTPSFKVQIEPHPLDVVAYTYDEPIALIWRATKQALVSQVEISRTTTMQIKAVTGWLQEHNFNVIHRRSIVKTAYQQTSRPAYPSV